MMVSFTVETVQFMLCRSYTESRNVSNGWKQDRCSCLSGTTQGTSTLELTFTPAEGIEELFTLENPTLTFEDGKSVAEAVITYKDINLLGVTDQYVLTLGFDEAKASPY